MDDALIELRRRMAEALENEYGTELPTLVWGEGPMQPALMLIGEAPGAQEAEQGRPFVGPAGKKLDMLLESIHLPREKLYVTNTVKFRPTRRSKAGRMVNRPPTRQEIDRFTPWLRKEIALVLPAMIATLGNVPLGALMGRDVRIGDLHGRLLQAPDIAAPLYPLYHPASILYNPSLRPVYEEDLQRLRILLAHKNDI